MAQVNGQSYPIEDGMTVETLLERLEIASKRIAVEVNRRVVPRADFARTALKQDDVVEIVAFVGGG